MENATPELFKPYDVKINETDVNSGQIIIEPLERGFGYTLGNALRRVLLSSIPGSAVVEVEIDQALHEYTTIPGVQEDMVEILLNLKKLAIRLHSQQETLLNLEVKGPAVVKASDIQLNHDVEIANPDLVIAHVAEGSSFSMRLKIAKGKGYVPASVQKLQSSMNPSIGTHNIALDASFSPIKRVTYHVESVRFEQRTDWDRLVVEVLTNGIIAFQDAIRDAAKLLAEGFLSLAAKIEQKEKDLLNLNILKEDIAVLELSARTLKALAKEEITIVSELIRQTESQLTQSPNIGKKILVEIKEALEKRQLSLGMN